MKENGGISPLYARWNQTCLAALVTLKGQGASVSAVKHLCSVSQVYPAGHKGQNTDNREAVLTACFG